MKEQAPQSQSIPNAQGTRCKCHSCGHEIEFQGQRNGDFVNCPYCMMETILYFPNGKGEPGSERLVLRVWQVGWDVQPDRYRCIVGQVKNESPRQLDWVRIEFPLLNGVDEQVGTASDCILSLEGGKTWAFRVPIFMDDVARPGLPTLKTELGKLSPGDLLKTSSEVQTISDIRYHLETRELVAA